MQSALDWHSPGRIGPVSSPLVSDVVVLVEEVTGPAVVLVPGSVLVVLVVLVVLAGSPVVGSTSVLGVPVVPGDVVVVPAVVTVSPPPQASVRGTKQRSHASRMASSLADHGEAGQFGASQARRAVKPVRPGGP
jgi:hypothetical protein